MFSFANTTLQTIETDFTPKHPAWCLNDPKIIFNLHSENRSKLVQFYFKDDCRKLQTNYNQATTKLVFHSDETYKDKLSMVYHWLSIIAIQVTKTCSFLHAHSTET